MNRPEWLKVRIPSSGSVGETGGCVHDASLHTVCEEARCPNIGECFARSTATFMILGTVCTRRCRFCAVGKERSPSPVDPDEPRRIVDAVRRMGLDYVVVTSVTRDDLEDGGASHFAECIRLLHAEGLRVEVLVPDFGGDEGALEVVLEAGPDVLNHNVETVPSLYEEVRPGASYERSLELLKRASSRGMITKSGLMVGLGETRRELFSVMDDLVGAGCDMLTVGQYLSPTREHIPVKRFVPPEEFALYREEALRRGFRAAACAPLVRSSYRAAAMFREVQRCRG